jgi:hypothetical protein
MMPLKRDHMEPGHIYAAFQKVWDDFGTIQVGGALRRFMVDEGYLWRAPTDEEWEEMRRHFHQHMANRKRRDAR